MAKRYELSDAQWDRIKDLLSGRPAIQAVACRHRRHDRRHPFHSLAQSPHPARHNLYKARNRIERCFNKLKHFRRFATRLIVAPSTSSHSSPPPLPCYGCAECRFSLDQEAIGEKWTQFGDAGRTPSDARDLPPLGRISRRRLTSFTEVRRTLNANAQCSSCRTPSTVGTAFEMFDLTKSRKAFARVLLRFLRRSVPRNRVGDYLFSLTLFIMTFHRIPTRSSGLFNDRMFFLKVSHELSDPLRVFVSDKEYVKMYVEATVGSKYNVPTIAVLRSEKEVDFFIFPAVCCVKATHLSNKVMFITDRDVDRDQIKAWMRLNYYDAAREVNYKKLKGKIIVEPLIFGQQGPTDYKLHCYRGAVKVIAATEGRYGGNMNPRRVYYSRDWGRYSFSTDLPPFDGEMTRPDNLEEMISVAEALSIIFDYIRVDMYSDGKRCFVGELTNLNGGGLKKFVPPDAEEKYSHLFFA